MLRSLRPRHSLTEFCLLLLGTTSGVLSDGVKSSFSRELKKLLRERLHIRREFVEVFSHESYYSKTIKTKSNTHVNLHTICRCLLNVNSKSYVDSQCRYDESLKPIFKVIGLNLTRTYSLEKRVDNIFSVSVVYNSHRRSDNRSTSTRNNFDEFDKLLRLIDNSRTGRVDKPRS